MHIQMRTGAKLKPISDMRKIFPILLIGLLTSCSTNNNVIENKVFCFDTTVISKLYEGEQANLDDIRDIFLYYDRVSDNYKDREGITIKKIGSDPLTVEPQLYDLLKTSVEAKEKGATKIVAEEIYDWNVDFFIKAGYKVAGQLSDFPKGHSYYIVEKDI